ncbi:MAG TPA: ParB/RepB/Spo0J family partition protein [Bryobacteraceae bacterium]|nr:ParB/RepB/Spo0J family partition protein [Bryobacteraceae bacterium]
MTKNDPRKALGKGLHSLLPQRPTQPAPAPAPESPRDGNLSMVPIDHVKPNPNQPRREFDPVAMMELTQSIERDGIIQPIIVRRTAAAEYEIIAGERRWRAAKTAGLKEVPVIPRTADDETVLELAIVENIQREDLNPIELAQAFQRMAAELNLSHDQIGEKTGKDRATVTNTIRLLQLPPDLQPLVAARKLSPGHARSLLKITDEEVQRQTADRCLREGWSVRQIEEYTRPGKPGVRVPNSSGRTAADAGAAPPDPNVKAAVAELERVLGTRVRLVEKGRDRGNIEIEYYSTDDLDRIYSLIVGESS